jgi:hypothetical protein
MRVIPTLDEVEYRNLRLGLALEAVTIKQFRFQRREEALGHRVVA